MSQEVKQDHKSTEMQFTQRKWRNCDISELCGLQRGFDITEATRTPGKIPVYSSSGQSYFHNEAKLNPPAVITGRKGILGKVYYIDTPCWPHDTTLWVKDFKGNDPRFVYWFLTHIRLERFDAATSVPTLNRNNLVGVPISLPPLVEQCAIAATLSDMDALISGLDQLIAKKRDIKQAAMQLLLTGQKRLAGFNGEWEMQRLGDVAFIAKGVQLSSAELVNGGRFAHLNGGITPSGYTDNFNTAGESIAISEGGNSCGYVQLMREPFWCGGHCYSVSARGVDNYFLYHALKGQQNSIMALRVGSGLPNVQKSALADFVLTLPSCQDEQVEIARILSDMDTELSKLESELQKSHQLKQGMMQELLTGRTRLL